MSAIGTIRLEDFERLTSPGMSDPSIRVLLAQRQPFMLSADLTEEELEAAQAR